MRKVEAIKAISKLRYDQLHTLRRGHEHRDSAQRFLNAQAVMSPLSSTDTVFRFSESGQPLQGKYEKPHRDVQPPTHPPPWRELTEAEARSVVMEGGSLLVQGSPGVGKTHWVRELVKALRSGKRVNIVAKTHASVSNFGEGTVTADHYVRRHVRSGGCVKCDVLVCEEITQMEHQLWADFCKLALGGVSFILCGDFEQFGACCETHMGAPVPEGALERSHMILDL